MLGSRCSGEGGGCRERDVRWPWWIMAHSVLPRTQEYTGSGTDKTNDRFWASDRPAVHAVIESSALVLSHKQTGGFPTEFQRNGYSTKL
jgi:hypothetical protein